MKKKICVLAYFFYLFIYLFIFYLFMFFLRGGAFEQIFLNFIEDPITVTWCWDIFKSPFGISVPVLCIYVTFLCFGQLYL